MNSEEVIYFSVNNWLNSHYFDYRGLIEKGLLKHLKEYITLKLNNYDSYNMY